MIEYDDDLNTLTKSIFDHEEDEFWSIASSPQNKLQFLTCNKLSATNTIQMKCSILQLAENFDMSIPADDSTHYSLKHLAELNYLLFFLFVFKIKYN